MIEDSCQAKVPKLDIVVGVEEHVGRLEVAVKDGLAVAGPTVTLFEGQDGLVKDAPYEALLSEVTERKGYYTWVSNI